MTSRRNESIAERKLLFASKGEELRRNVVVRVLLPSELVAEDVDFSIHRGSASCRVEFDGMDEPAYVAHGADTLQALQFAADIDPILRGMKKKYDFFFDTGEPYFDEK